MKTVLFITIFVSSLLACTGDCLTCHPNLLETIETDLRHRPMQTCINCHSDTSNSMAECGSDCFACHDVKKINKYGIKEHEVIEGCRDCHMKLKKKLFGIPQENPLSLKDKLFILE